MHAFAIFLLEAKDTLKSVTEHISSSFFLTLGSGLKQAFKQASDEYRKRTCIRFEEKTDDDEDYIEIISGTG